MDELGETLANLIDESRLPPDPSLALLKQRAEKRSRRRSPARSMVVMPLIVLVAVAVVVLVLQLLPSTGRRSTSAAAAVLMHAASVAANQPANSVPGAGQYLYYRTTQGSIEDSGAPVGQRHFLLFSTMTTDNWVTTDGAGRERVNVTTHLLAPSEKEAWEAAGSPHSASLTTGIYEGTFPSKTLAVGMTAVSGTDGEYRLTYPSSSDLPTNPAALKRYLDHYDNNSDPVTAFLTASDIFEKGASPALRSALFQVIEKLPGVTVVGPTRDEAGRSGLGIEIDSPASFYSGGNLRILLIFDPNTSAVLGNEAFAGASYNLAGVPVPKGTLVSFNNYGPVAIVSSTSALPN